MAGRKVIVGPDEFGNPSQIALSDRNVTDNQLFNALAITDTANHDSTEINLSSLGGLKYLHVESTLDQACTLTFITYPEYGSSLNGVSQSANINATSYGSIVDSTGIGALQLPITAAKVRLSCATAPTTGSISVWLKGVPA